MGSFVCLNGQEGSLPPFTKNCCKHATSYCKLHTTTQSAGCQSPFILPACFHSCGTVFANDIHELLCIFLHTGSFAYTRSNHKPILTSHDSGYHFLSMVCGASFPWYVGGCVCVCVGGGQQNTMNKIEQSVLLFSVFFLALKPSCTLSWTPETLVHVFPTLNQKFYVTNMKITIFSNHQKP